MGIAKREATSKAVCTNYYLPTIGLKVLARTVFLEKGIGFLCTVIFLN